MNRPAIREALCLAAWGAMGAGYVLALIIADALHSVPSI